MSPARRALGSVSVSPDEQEPEVVGADVGPRTNGFHHTDADLVVAGSFEHQRLMAVGALAEAAEVVLAYPRDPQAAEAEHQFETVLEIVVQLYWRGDGTFDGVAHPGIKRERGHVLLEGVARVRGGADRPVRVDISPQTGGTVLIDTPPKKRRGLRRSKITPATSTQVVQIPSTATRLTEG